MAGIGVPGSKVAIGTRAKPGTGKPASAPNAVLGNSKVKTPAAVAAKIPVPVKPVAVRPTAAATATPVSYAKGPAVRPAPVVPKPAVKIAGVKTGVPITPGKSKVPPATGGGKLKPPPGGWKAPTGGWGAGTHGKNWKPGTGQTGTGQGTKPKPTGPTIPKGDVIDQQAIRNQWLGMQYGTDGNMGIRGIEDQIKGLAAGGYAQYNTRAADETNNFNTALTDWRAQAAASGMLNSGGRFTNDQASTDVWKDNIKNLDEQYGKAATVNLMGQRDDLRAQGIQQLLALFGQKNAANINQIVGG
jgi:hypothetical protein